MGNKNKWPVFMMSIVMVPGLIIGVLGIYLVTQQKTARMLDVRREFTTQLNLTREAIETQTRQLVETVFRQLDESNPSPGDPDSLLTYTRSVMLHHPIVQYPFFISRSQGFLFPLSRKADLPPEASASREIQEIMSRENRAVKADFLKGYDLEYKEKKFRAAVKAYLKSLDSGVGEGVKPYVFVSIGRCYFKLKLYRQAIHYYNRGLSGYQDQVAGGETKERRLFHFTILRQIAVSFKRMGLDQETHRAYLQLYEACLNLNVPRSGPFAFYKNEALDYLNRWAQHNKEENDSRFHRAKTMDKLDKASDIEIALQWRFFDTGDRSNRNDSNNAEMDRGQKDRGQAAELTNRTVPQPERRNDAFRFLKLRELYESNNEKVRFYSYIKDNIQRWVPGAGSGDLPGVNSIAYRFFGDGASQQTVPVCSRRVVHTGMSRGTVDTADTADTGAMGTVSFGFMVSLEHIERRLVPLVAAQRGLVDGVFVRLHGTETEETGTTPDQVKGVGLITVPMGPLLPGRHLTLYAHERGFFESEVEREIRLYYVLLAALVLALVGGIFLFYKYISREAELVRLKSEFVDSASHTLKTPLTRMSLLAENVAQGWVTDAGKKQEFFNTIVSETARMSEMIDNMLNFSRIEAGKQHYEPEPQLFQEIVAGVIENYAPYTRSLGFEVELSLDETLPAVKVDKKAARLMAGNLVQNAVKYSGDEKWIGVRVFREDKELVFEVADRGIGIDRKYIPLLFRKFSRVPDDKVSALEGSGLGLFLVRHAVEACGGKVSVVSEPGKGTTFTVRIPL